MGRKRAKKLRKTTRQKKSSPKRQEVKLEELKAILSRARTSSLSQEDLDKLEGAVDTLAFLTQELEKKGASINRLRKLIFGASTEKTRQVVGQGAGDGDSEAATPTGVSTTGDDSEAAGVDPQKKKQKRKGHGRNGAAAYQGAEKVKVPHESLQPGDPCPECPKGKVYPVKEPAVLVRVTGMAPLCATVYELERLRCNLCGVVFVAQSPEGVGTAKYDESAQAMVALLKYGTGMPFNRLERLQRGLGIPLPASTQWDLVKAAAGKLVPAYAEIIRQAAQGDVLHNDDTTARILDLMGLRREQALAKGELLNEERTGLFTTGIVSTSENRRIAVFFTGQQHAGENLADVLAQRAAELAPPIQMSDALSVNTPGDFETIVANCILHARRKFVDVAESFPDEVRHVLEELRKVYKNDAFTRKQGMSAEQRLLLHQQKSGSVMEDLTAWMQALLDEKKVEPNSTLGEAIGYMTDHWEKLTLFLHVPGAPLDNNIVERSLKKAILHRKNAYFYRSPNGARVGDLFMTFIHTTELCGGDPFDYLVSLLRYADKVADSPSDWMPWSYRKTVEGLTDTS